MPLASIDNLAFGGWDIYEDNCYEAASKAGVLDRALLEQVKDELEAIQPMPAVFEQRFVTRIHGPNVKKGGSKMEMAEALMDDIRRFRESSGALAAGDGMVRLDRDLIRRRRPFTPAWPRLKKGCGRATPRSRQARSMPTPR